MASEASFCHVFLSFRGETRDKFTCFLYEALKAEGFVAFMDKSDISVGDEVDLTIKEGIKNSMSAIIIFSQNYAYSTWCLDELVLILERKKNSRYFIIPIFYEVDVRDIKHQLRNYGLALEHHRARHQDKVDKWRDALVEVGNILGDHVQGLQSTFIKNTVKLFGDKLSAKFPECRLPMPNNLDFEGSYSSSLSKCEPSYNKITIYTSSVLNGLGANVWAKKGLMSGNVVSEERDCSKEPKHLSELVAPLDIAAVNFCPPDMCCPPDEKAPLDIAAVNFCPPDMCCPPDEKAPSDIAAVNFCPPDMCCPPDEKCCPPQNCCPPEECCPPKKRSSRKAKLFKKIISVW